MLKHRQVRRILALSASAFFLAASLPVEARVGSSSRSSSFSSSSASRSMSSSSSSRVGSGQSMGMQRSAVMNNVRSAPPAPSAPPPRTTYVPPAPAPVAPAPVAKPDRSWVAPAAAGLAVGAVTTYALTHNNNSNAPAPTVNNGNGGYAPGNGGYAQGNSGVPANNGASAPMANGFTNSYPASVAPASSGFGFGSFLMLLLVGGLGFAAYRYVTKPNESRALGNKLSAGYSAARSAMSAPAPVATSDDSLEQKAKDLFLALQAKNNEGDLDALKALTTADLYEGLAEDIRQRQVPSQTEVRNVTAHLVDHTHEGTQEIMSVRFDALISEGPNQPFEAIDEVWHFLKDSPTASWRVAGIEQV